MDFVIAQQKVALEEEKYSLPQIFYTANILELSMRTISNISRLVIIIVVFSILVMMEPIFAQTIPEPSVPEFTVKFVPSTYSVTTSNPYTGESSTTQCDNNTIEIAITNQDYTYSNGSSFYLYYNIRTKGHFEENWTELYPTVGLLPNAGAYQHADYRNYYAKYIAFTAEDSRNSYFGLTATNSKYTTVVLPANYPQNGSVDFQVEAMIGQNATYYDPTNDIVYDPSSGGVNRPAMAHVTSSGWSNTQTINISDGQVSVSSSLPDSSATPTSQNPTTTPIQPNVGVGVFGLGWLGVGVVVFVVVLAVLLVAVAVFWRRRKS
jgi:hypothetical protein